MASSFPPIIAGNPPIKTYRIITRAGVTSTVQAFGYSEDKSLGRIYFHQEANWSDQTTSFSSQKSLESSRRAPSAL